MVKDSEEISNFDAQGMLSVLDMLGNKFSEAPNNIYDPSDLYSPTNQSDAWRLFNTNNIIKKIITRYPQEARQIGYRCVDEKGKVINENDDILLDAFYEASVYSRLYGTTFLVLNFESNKERRINFNEQLIDFEIRYELKLDGDFYFDREEERFHKDKVIVWEGQKTYRKLDSSNERNNGTYRRSVSILDGMYRSYINYMQANDTARYILQNISYLALGHEGLAAELKTDIGKQKVYERLLAVNRARDVQRLISYDKVTEEVKFVSQTLAGIQDVISELRSIFVSDTEYPEDILFEESPRGHNSSGTQNQLIQRYLWAKRCNTWVNNNWLKHYQYIFTLWLKLNPDKHKVEIPFKFEQTPAEQAELEDKAADRVQKLVGAGIIAPQEARTGYLGDEFTLNIVLDEAAFKKMELSAKPQPDLPTDNKGGGEPKVSGNPAQIPNKDAEIVNDRTWEMLAEVTQQDLVELALDMANGRVQNTDSEKRFVNLEGIVNYPGNVYEIVLSENEDNVYGLGFNSSDDAEEFYLGLNPSKLAGYMGIVEIDTHHNEDVILNKDKGCAKENIIRDKMGRFAGCRGNATEDEVKTAKTTKKALGGSSGSITSKTTIAQLREISEKHGIETPTKYANRKQSWIDAIKAHPEGAQYFKASETEGTAKTETKTETKTATKTTKARLTPEQKAEAKAAKDKEKADIKAAKDKEKADIKAAKDKEKADLKAAKEGTKKVAKSQTKEPDKTPETVTVKKPKNVQELRDQLDAIEAKFVAKYREAEERERQAIKDIEAAVDKGKDPSAKQYKAKKDAETEMLNIRVQTNAERKGLALSYVKTNRSTDTQEIQTHGMATPEQMWSIKSGNLTLHGTGELTIRHPMVDYFVKTAGKEEFPDEFIKHTKNVYMTSKRSKHDAYWEQQYNTPGFESGATGGDGNIVTYNGRGITREVLAHEAGHNFATARYGTTNPPKDSEYGKAFKIEGLNKLSDYAHNSIAEDFAESMSAYFNRKPSEGDKLNHDNLRKDHPARYSVIRRLVENPNYNG